MKNVLGEREQLSIYKQISSKVLYLRKIISGRSHTTKKILEIPIIKVAKSIDALNIKTTLFVGTGKAELEIS